jgi:hypothetical protein
MSTTGRHVPSPSAASPIATALPFVSLASDCSSRSAHATANPDRHFGGQIHPVCGPLQPWSRWVRRHGEGPTTVASMDLSETPRRSASTGGGRGHLHGPRSAGPFFVVHAVLVRGAPGRPTSGPLSSGPLCEGLGRRQVQARTARPGSGPGPARPGLRPSGLDIGPTTVLCRGDSGTRIPLTGPRWPSRGAEMSH